MLGEEHRRYPRAMSRPVTDLGAIAQGEPRIEELLELLDGATDPQRRIYILQEVARVYREELLDPQSAAVALRAALQEDCSHGAVIATLEELAGETDGWNQLLTELMEDATTLADDEPRRAADLWLRAARWYDDPVGHREFATHAVRQSLELVPHHVEALAMLATLLRDDGYWVELISVLQRQAAVTADDDERLRLYLEVADVADSQLGEHQTAIEACRAALDVNGACQDAFDTLRSLLRRTDAAEEVAELLTQRSALIDDPDEHLELAIDIARIYGEQLGDDARAERAWEAIDDTGGAIQRLTQLVATQVTAAERAALHYRLGWYLVREADAGPAEWHLLQALAEEAAHLPSLKMLADIYRLRGDWRKAAAMIDRTAAATGDAALVLDSARIRADELNDVNGAIACCQQALEANPSSSPIRRMLAVLYARVARWADLSPLLRDLEGELDDPRGQRDEARTIYVLQARCAAELGDAEAALTYYERAHDIAPNHPEVLRGLGDHRFSRSEWGPAANAYGALLRAGVAAEDESAIRYRLGVALRALGDQPGALESFRRVTELEPNHLPALDAVSDLLVAAGQWRAAARAKRALLDLAPPDESARIMIELGDIHRDHLREPRQALPLYTAAIEREPGSHAALQRRLDTATALRAWPVAIDSIERFAAAEEVPMRRGAYLHAAAVIQRDELHAGPEAADLFERALDAFFADPAAAAADLTRCMKPFAALDAWYTSKRDWAEQARAYRRMIKRIPPGNPVAVDLWHGLGEIYRSRLKRYQEAAAAFEVACKLDPDNVERRAILAELYQRTSGGSPDSAAEEHHALLALDPARADSYRALREIYVAARRMDQAWCACRALVFLERATPEEAQLYQRYQSTTLAPPRAPISADMRSRIVCPDESGTVAITLALVRGLVARARPYDLGLRDGDVVDPRKERRKRIRMVAHLAAALGQSFPRVYDQSRRAGPLGYGLCPISGSLQPVIATRRDYLGLDDKPAAFAVGRALALLDPGRVLAVMFTGDELRAILRWVLHEPEGDATELRAILDREAGNLRLDQREQLERSRKRLARADWQADLDRWLRAVVTTADRTGFLLCGDLTEAARMIAQSRDTPGGLTPAARILELLRFSVTDDHANIRRALCGRV